MNEITMEAVSSLYRASLFDGAPSLSWLQLGWRGLRYYGRRAAKAMAAGDVATKAQMIARADELLTVMSGILDTSQNAALGPALMTIYSALRHSLFRATTEDSLEALRDYDVALSLLDRDLVKTADEAEVS